MPEDTESVEVYATTQEAKAKVTGTGKKTLEKGENKAEVIVTAEDGTTKTYTINIIRGTQQEEDKKEETQTSNGIAELKIENTKITPEFKTNVYEYRAKYIGEDTKLKIEAKPTNEEYNIEIIGNNNLQEGENTITLLVSQKDGENIATYQITVNKSLVDEEAIAKEEEAKKQNTKNMIIGAVVAIIALIVVVAIIWWIRKRNTRLEEEYSGRLFYDRDDDYYEEDDEEEVPRAFRGKRFKDEQEELEPIEQAEELEENEEEKPWEQEKTKVMNWQEMLKQTDFRAKEEKHKTSEDQVKQKPKEFQRIEEKFDQDFETMPKEKIKEEFLNGYTTQNNFDFEDNSYRDKRIKGKHRGKRFK